MLMSDFPVITVLGIPRPAGSRRAFINKHSGKAMLAPACGEQKNWQQQVASVAEDVWAADRVDRSSIWRPVFNEGPVAMRADFYFARPKNHWRSNGSLKASAGNLWVPKTPDLDKLVRAVCDALTGIVWRDDAQVAHMVLNKWWGYNHVDIRVVPLIANSLLSPFAE